MGRPGYTMRAFADTKVETAPLDGMALRDLQDSWDEWRGCTETIKVRTYLPVFYGNRDCQASKGLDKHVSDGDAGFVDM